MKIVVGGSGLIGSKLVEALRQSGRNVARGVAVILEAEALPAAT